MHSVLSAGARLGYQPRASDETIPCCIYRRHSCIFNAEEGMEPQELLLLRHQHHCTYSLWSPAMECDLLQTSFNIMDDMGGITMATASAVTATLRLCEQL